MCCCIDIKRPPPMVDAVGIDNRTGKCAWLQGHWWNATTIPVPSVNETVLFVGPGGSNASVTPMARHTIDEWGNTLDFEVINNKIGNASGNIAPPLLESMTGDNSYYCSVDAVAGVSKGGVCEISSGKITWSESFPWSSNSFFLLLDNNSEGAYSLGYVPDSNLSKVWKHPGLTEVLSLTGSQGNWPFTLHATDSYYALWDTVYDSSWLPIRKIVDPFGGPVQIYAIFGDFVFAKYSVSSTTKLNIYSISDGSVVGTVFEAYQGELSVQVSPDEQFVIVKYTSPSSHVTVTVYDRDLDICFSDNLTTGSIRPQRGRQFIPGGALVIDNTTYYPSYADNTFKKFDFEGAVKWTAEIPEEKSYTYWPGKDQIVFGLNPAREYNLLPDSLKIYG